MFPKYVFKLFDPSPPLNVRIREIGVLPTVQPGATKKWHPTIQSTIKLGMPGVRSYILNKLAEDKAIIATTAVDFLSWIQDNDEWAQDLFLQCIQILAFRRSPLSHDEAHQLSSTMVNAVALARERVRSLFYNPNYWKVRIANTLCRAANHHCSDGVFLAMAKQMSISVKPSEPGSEPSPEPDLLQIAVNSMCAACGRRSADLVKQHAILEIRKSLGNSDETETQDPNPPSKLCSK
ncbi:unnamed protein product [Rhizoctonia solani]|uniref:Uncharacterized protein n=1 Tax=Rhizoctonia solani TaxID=456999 RepID=A0A8H3E759_9AGAM|nr:unnamed protein product [Rhizoctonia solani]